MTFIKLSKHNKYPWRCSFGYLPVTTGQSTQCWCPSILSTHIISPLSIQFDVTCFRNLPSVLETDVLFIFWLYLVMFTIVYTLLDNGSILFGNINENIFPNVFGNIWKNWKICMVHSLKLPAHKKKVVVIHQWEISQLAFSG